MVRSTFSRISQKTPVTVGVVILLLASLVFLRDFDYPLRHLDYGIFLALGFTTLYLIVSDIRLALKQFQWPLLLRIAFAATFLVIAFLFRMELTVLREKMFFNRHQDDLTQLLNQLDSMSCEYDCHYLRVSTQDQEWLGAEIIYNLLDSEGKSQMVAIPMRPNTYLIYMPNTDKLFTETMYLPLRYAVECFYQIQDSWFLCDMWR